MHAAAQACCETADDSPRNTGETVLYLQIVAGEQQLQAVVRGSLRLLLPTDTCCLYVCHQPCKGGDVTLHCDLCGTQHTWVSFVVW